MGIDNFQTILCELMNNFIKLCAFVVEHNEVCAHERKVTLDVIRQRGNVIFDIFCNDFHINWLQADFLEEIILHRLVIDDL